MVLPTVLAQGKFKCIEMTKSSFSSHGRGSNHKILRTLGAKSAHSYNFPMFLSVDSR